MTGRRPRVVGRRGEVLQLLRDVDDSLSIAQVAERLGIHANTVCFHLDTLVSDGQVAGMDRMGPRHYRILAEVLAADPNPRRKGMDAGRHWGRLYASARTETGEECDFVEPSDAVERLMRMLDELDFAPERPTGDNRSQIALRHCPFLELAESRSEIACSVHLSLIQRAMDLWDPTVAVDRLDTFVEPDLCMAHLSAGSGPQSRREAPDQPSIFAPICDVK